MSKKFIDVRFIFDEVTEDEDYTYYELSEIRRHASTVPDGEDKGIAETWAQSDRYWVGICNDLIGVICGETKRYAE